MSEPQTKKQVLDSRYRLILETLLDVFWALILYIAAGLAGLLFRYAVILIDDVMMYAKPLGYAAVGVELVFYFLIAKIILKRIFLIKAHLQNTNSDVEDVS